MVVLQKSENQIYADIVGSLKQNLRPEFQPSFDAAHGKRKVRIRTGCHYKSQLPEDHWREKYNRNVQQRHGGSYTPASVLSSVFSSSCLKLRRSMFVHGLLLAMLFPPSRKKWSNHIHTVWYKVTWLGGILIPKFLNTMRDDWEGFKWEKNTRPQTSCP